MNNMRRNRQGALARPGVTQANVRAIVALIEHRIFGPVSAIAVLLLATALLLGATNTAFAQESVLEFTDAQFGGYGLRQASAVVTSHDDNFIYVASEQDDAIVLFSRDSTTGKPVYVRTYVNSEEDIDGLNNPVALEVSQDGLSLYALGSEPDPQGTASLGTVVVFTRDIETGELFYVETQRNGVDLVEQMFAPDDLTVSPDGLNVYVAGDVALTIFERAASDDGRLSFVDAKIGEAPATLVLRDVATPDNETVYVTERLQNAVIVLNRDASDKGKLTVAQTLQEGVGGVTGLAGVEKLTVSPDGENIYATGSISGTVVTFSRAEDGELAYVSTLTDGQAGVDGIGGARSIETSADGLNVYVAGPIDDAMTVFNRDESGELTFSQCFMAGNGSSPCQPNVPGLRGPSGIAVASDGLHLYVTGKNSDSLGAYNRQLDGSLSLLEVLFNEEGGVPGMAGASAMALSPDGKHVYVTALRSQAVVVYERDSADNGVLNYVEQIENGTGGIRYMFGPTGVVVSPDGKHVYVTAREPTELNRGSLVIFSRDVTTGKLTYLETLINAESGVQGLAGAYGIAMSPDGLNVYVTGISTGTVVTMRRDPDTGKLTPRQIQFDGVSGVSGLNGAAGIVVSPEGSHVYVAGSEDASVVVFSREGDEGQLKFVERLTNGVDGVHGLAGAISVDIAPTGTNVYVASILDGGVATFKRDINTGELTFVGPVNGAAVTEEDETEQAVEKLYWAVAVAEDSKYVYAVRWEVTTSVLDPVGSLVVFARKADTGILSEAQVLRNGSDGVRGMRSPTSVVVSPDSANVYSTSPQDSSILTFKVVGSADYSDARFLPMLMAEQ